MRTRRLGAGGPEDLARIEDAVAPGAAAGDRCGEARMATLDCGRR